MHRLIKVSGACRVKGDKRYLCEIPFRGRSRSLGSLFEYFGGKIFPELTLLPQCS